MFRRNRSAYIPTGYIVLRQGKLILKRWTGVVSYEKMMSQNQRLYQDTSIQPGACVLSDARDAVFESPPEKIKELIEHEKSTGHIAILSKPESVFMSSKIAILCSEENYQHAKTFEKLARKYNINVIVFSNFSVACRWIGIDPDEAGEHLKNIQFKDE